MQENPNIPQRWCQSSQTLQLKYWENPVLLFEKSLRRSPSFHFHMDGKWPFLRQKSLSSVPSGTTPHWIYQRDAFQQDSWMTPFHGQPQTIKHLKPCLHRRLDEVHYFLFCLLGSTINQVTSVEHQTHLDSTAPHPSKNLTKLDLNKFWAGSLDDWKFFLYLLWKGWSLSFLQLIRINISLKNESVSRLVMSNSLWLHGL